MITLRSFLALVLLSFCAGPLLAADAPAVDKDAERETLEKAIPYGISLLEAKNYKAFLEAFMKPDDLKEITAKPGLDAFIAEFTKDMADDVLVVLKKMKDLKPKLDEKGTTATYTLPEKIKGESEFKFAKVGKYWYID